MNTNKAKGSPDNVCTFAATGEFKLGTNWKGKTEEIKLLFSYVYRILV
jgi:hypothetical protein